MRHGSLTVQRPFGGAGPRPRANESQAGFRDRPIRFEAAPRRAWTDGVDGGRWTGRLAEAPQEPA